MAAPCRSWWRNCAAEADDEIRAIDRMEDDVAPLEPEVVKTRELISTFELCHHKAERWAVNILEAIGSGHTQKGLGTRAAGSLHPAEQVWQNACDALSAWCADTPAASVDTSIGDLKAADLLACLGERSPLKEWQVERVIDKIRSHVPWPPAAEYVWLLLDCGAYEVAYRDRCPEPYRGHKTFWKTTARTIIHDTADGVPRRISLALAIDMLFPCHWRFPKNLEIVLAAIGGQLHPEEPYAACGRNIALTPLHGRMGSICSTLRHFCDPAAKSADVDRETLALLGDPTPTKRWLAASFTKTIALQVDPPAAMREMSALCGPEWVTR